MVIKVGLNIIAYFTGEYLIKRNILRIEIKVKIKMHQ